MTEQHEAAISRCYRAFGQRDYWGCADSAKQVPLAHAPYTLMLVYMISKQRLAEPQAIEKVRSKYLERFGSVPYLQGLLPVALDRGSLNLALPLAESEEDRCRLLFYAGANAETGGSESYSHYLASAMCDCRCDEHDMAAALIGVKTPGSPDDARQQCVAAFTAQDYADCVNRWLGLAELHAETDVTTQLLLISLQRLGQVELAEAVGWRYLSLNTLGRWEAALLRLTLGSTTLAEVLRLVDSEARSCQAWLYWGARLVTLGRKSEAVPSFDTALVNQTDILEHELAAAERARLERFADSEHAAGGTLRKPWEQVTIFISSTFRDMHAEREHLIREVFPTLRRFCSQRRVLLHEIDLRWGVTDDEDAFERCRAEIKRCHPFFICMLGGRYGWVQPPRIIEASVLDRLLQRGCLSDDSPRESILSAPERDFIRSYYHFEDRVSSGSQERYLLDAPTSLTEAERLRLAELLERGGVNKAGYSITELEIDYGALQPPNETLPEEPVRFFYFRDPALTQSVPAVPVDRAAEYQDRSDWAANKLNSLKVKIRAELARRGEVPRMYGQTASWDDAIIPSWDPEQRGAFVGIEGFGRRVQADLEGAIEARFPLANRTGELDPQDAAMDMFIWQHVREQGGARTYFGRDQLLAELYAFATTPGQSSPTLMGCVTGPSGIGKSALMANLAYQLNQNPVLQVIWHFVGAAADSTSDVAVLKRFCRKLGATKADIEATRDQTFRLVGLLREALNYAASKRRVVLLIDGLDQLDLAGEGQLAWREVDLPQGARMIVSTIDDSQNAERSLQPGEGFAEGLTGQVRTTFFGVPDLSEAEKLQIIGSYLDRNGKHLKTEFQLALARKPESGNPLYLRVALDELRALGGNRLYLEIGDRIAALPTSTVGLFCELIRRLEEQNKSIPELVRIVLGTICISRFRGGLTERELDCLVKNQCGEIASGAYARVLLALRPYLIERADEYGNVSVSFFHQQLFIASEQYFELSNSELQESLHRSVAQCLFSLGNPEGAQVCWEGNRETPSEIYRTLSELPYHLERAGNMWDLLAEVLCDLEFIQAKCSRALVLDLLNDYQRALQAWPNYHLHSPFGRQGSQPDWIGTCTAAVSQGDEDPYPDLGSGPQLALLRETRQPQASFTVWDLDNGNCTGTFTGHLWDVNSVAMTSDGKIAVSGSADATVRVWEVDSGRCLHVLSQHKNTICGVAITADGLVGVSVDTGGVMIAWDVVEGESIGQITTAADKVTDLHLSADGKLALTVAPGCLSLWDLELGCLAKEIRDSEWAILRATMASNGQTIVSVGNVGGLRVWDAPSEVCWGRLSGLSTQRGDSEQSGQIRALAITPDGEWALSGGDDHRLSLWDITACRLSQTLTGHRDSIRSVALTPDGGRAVSLSDDQTLRVWNLRQGTCVRTIREIAAPTKRIAMSADGRFAILAAPPQDSSKPLLVQNQISNFDFAPGPEVQSTILQIRGADVMDSGVEDAERELSAPERVETFFHFIAGQVDRLGPQGFDVITLAYNHAENGYVTECAETLVTQRRSPWVACESRPLASRAREAVIRTLIAPPGYSEIKCMALTADGATVISAGGDDEEKRTIRVWDVNGGRCRRVLSGHSEGITDLKITPGGELAVSASLDHTLRVWDLRSGSCLHVLSGHAEPVSSVSITADGRLAASAGKDRFLIVWDLRTGKCIRTLDGHYSINQKIVHITPDGKLVLSGSNGPEIRVWDTARGTCLREYFGPEEITKPNIMAVSSDGRFALSERIYPGEQICCWAIASGSVLRYFENKSFHAAASANAQWIISEQDQELCIQSISTGEKLRTFPKSSWNLKRTAITSDGRIAVTAVSDEGRHGIAKDEQGLLVWDAAAGRTSRSNEKPKLWIRGTAISSDRICVAHISGDETWYLSQISPYRLLRRCGSSENRDEARGHTQTVTCLAYSAGTRLVTSGSSDHTLRVWDIKNGQSISVMGKASNYSEEGGHTDEIRAVTFNKDGHTIASASKDYTVRLWDARTGSCLRTLGKKFNRDHAIGHTSEVFDVAVTPDGRKAVSVGMDGAICIWDLVRGICEKVIGNPMMIDDPDSTAGHVGFISCLALTADGRFAVTGSDDRTLRVWQLESGECIAVYPTDAMVFGLSQINPQGLLLWTDREHRSEKVQLRNVTCLTPLVTAALLWRPQIPQKENGSSGENQQQISDAQTGEKLPPTTAFADGEFIAGRYDDEPSARCPYCELITSLPLEVADAIDGITRNVKLKPEQSPCLALPAETWTETRLLSTCLSCGRALRFNPFLVDDRNILHQ